MKVVQPLDMVENSINPLGTHIGLICSSLGRPRVSFILSVHVPEPALTFTKLPLAFSRASSHFMHAHMRKHGTGAEDGTAPPALSSAGWFSPLPWLEYVAGSVALAVCHLVLEAA